MLLSVPLPFKTVSKRLYATDGGYAEPADKESSHGTPLKDQQRCAWPETLQGVTAGVQLNVPPGTVWQSPLQMRLWLSRALR